MRRSAAVGRAYHNEGRDEAIAVIGPNTGISPSLGLLDATGRPLARAIAASGLRPRNGQVHSIGELETWLNRGPLALDGARQFGGGLAASSAFECGLQAAAAPAEQS